MNLEVGRVNVSSWARYPYALCLDGELWRFHPGGCLEAYYHFRTPTTAYWQLSASIRALVRGDDCLLVCIGVPYIIVAGSIAKDFEFGSHDTLELYE